MDRPIVLHWSYDYDSGAQAPLFGRHVERLLARALSPAHRENDGRQCYAILPNFWSGYKSAAEIEADGGIAIGDLDLRRTRDADNCWNYEIRRTNSTSGETARYRFRTRDDPLRSVDGGWAFRSDQSGSGTFDGLEAKGLISGGRVLLTMSNRTIEIGRSDPADGIVPFWAISDWGVSGAGEIMDADGFDHVAVLENMSRLRRGVSFRRVGQWTQDLPASGLQIAMQGFMLSGQGLPPVYWWFADNGRLLVVSTTFQTYVLAGAGSADAKEEAVP